MDNLLSVKQVAYILKVHPLTVRRYIKEERLKAVKSGGNVRIKESDLSEFNKDFKPNTIAINKNSKQQTHEMLKIAFGQLLINYKCVGVFVYI